MTDGPVKRFRRSVRKLLSRSERIRLWYLERDLSALSRDYHREIEEARKGNGDRQEIESRYAFEHNYTAEEMESIRTERLLRRARALRVPLPSRRPSGFNYEDEDENWSLGSAIGEWTLTQEGEARLRQSIREEEKASRENAAFWFGIVTGVLGTLTGLVAVWKK